MFKFSIIIINSSRWKKNQISSLKLYFTIPVTMIWHAIRTDVWKNMNILKTIWIPKQNFYIEISFTFQTKKKGQTNLNFESGLLNFTKFQEKILNEYDKIWIIDSMAGPLAQSVTSALVQKLLKLAFQSSMALDWFITKQRQRKLFWFI